MIRNDGPETGYTRHVPVHIILVSTLGVAGYNTAVLTKAGIAGQALGTAVQYAVIVLMVLVTIDCILPIVKRAYVSYKEGDTA